MTFALKIVPLLFVVMIFVIASGCERKKKIVDIETPAGQIEVERSVDSGKVDVEVTDKN